MKGIFTVTQHCVVFLMIDWLTSWMGTHSVLLKANNWMICHPVIELFPVSFSEKYIEKACLNKWL